MDDDVASVVLETFHVTPGAPRTRVASSMKSVTVSASATNLDCPSSLNQNSAFLMNLPDGDSYGISVAGSQVTINHDDRYTLPSRGAKPLLCFCFCYIFFGGGGGGGIGEGSNSV